MPSFSTKKKNKGFEPWQKSQSVCWPQGSSANFVRISQFLRQSPLECVHTPHFHFLKDASVVVSNLLCWGRSFIEIGFIRLPPLQGLPQLWMWIVVEAITLTPPQCNPLLLVASLICYWWLSQEYLEIIFICHFCSYNCVGVSTLKLHEKQVPLTIWGCKY